jgi:hypothetical protein
LCCIWSPSLNAADPAIRVSFHDDRTKDEQSVEGRVLVEAVDGGILVEDTQRRLWTITPDRLISREDLAREYAPLDTEALAAALRADMGAGFKTSSTPHYVLCTDGPSAYTEWVGKLFERLLRAFLLNWKQAGWELAEPDVPLPALVFRNQQQYAAYALKDAGPEVADKAGYYSIRTNRIVLYDLASEGAGDGPMNADQVERRVAAAPQNVATIVHEATHQIAFNCGMHTRYADTPMWIAEGLAMYCETPDLRTGSGWRTIGKLNVTRLRQYREFSAQRRKEGSLRTLVQDESRFRNPDTMLDAYSESWALVDYLVRERRDEFITYLRQIAEKPRLRWDAPEVRITEFEEAFGSVDAVESECTAHARRLRAR